MKKEQLTLVAGFMPPLAMTILLGFEYLLESGRLIADNFAVMGAQIAAFCVPLIVLAIASKTAKPPVKPRLSGFTRRAIPFVLFMSITASLLSFLLSSGISLLTDRPFAQTTYFSMTSDLTVISMIAVAVIIPAIVEELFFRGTVQGALESVGTMPAIIMTSVAFSLVHASLDNLIGPLVAGLLFGYMAYVLDSAWPAVLAHMINNAVAIAFTYAVEAYQVFNFETYFITFCTFFFALFLYLSMRSLTKLLERGKIKKFKRVHIKTSLAGVFLSPGMWLLVIMFVIRVVYIQ